MLLELVAPTWDSADPITGIWQHNPVPESFDPTAREEAIWRIHLPAQADAAQADFSRVEAHLAGVEREVARLNDALVRLVAEELAAPSYGRLEDLHTNWEEARAALQQRLLWLEQHVWHAAWVETEIDSVVFGRTVLDWSGRSRTLWRDGAGRATVELHTRTLALAVRSRHASLQRLTLIVSSLLALSAALATPGGVLALPAAWQLIKNLLQSLAAPPGTQPNTTP